MSEQGRSSQHEDRPIEPEVTRPSADTVAEAVEALLDDLVTDDPVLGTALGLTAGAGRLPSWSPAARVRRRELLHEHERRLTPLLAAADTGAAVDAFAGLQVVRRRLRALELRRVAQRHPGAVLEVVAGVFPLLVRELGSPDERVDALAERLGAVPALLADARDALEPGLSAVAVENGIDYAEGLLDLVGPTARAFAASAGRDGAVDAPSAAAVAALETYRDHLRDDLAPTASGGCGAGAASSRTCSAGSTSSRSRPRISPRTAARSLAETKAAMEALAAASGYADAAAAVAAAQAATPAADELVDAYRRAVAEARAFVVGHDIVGLPAGEELEVVATPAFLRSLLPFAAYDAPGPFAERQLGFYYVTPPPDGLAGDEVRAILRGHSLASLRHDRGPRGLPRAPSAAGQRQPRADAGAPHRRHARRRQPADRGLGLLLRGADGPGGLSRRSRSSDSCA